MTAIPVSHRVPTGQIDTVLQVALDWATPVPLLLITTLRRSAADVDEAAFKPVYTTRLQIQFAELLIERIRAALNSGSGARPRGAA